MSFLRNAWYVAAWSDEVGPGQLFNRTYLGEPVLIYRKQDGVAVAMSDRCPHRFAPLHMGKMVGDSVECPYHGLVFDCSGTCTSNPHGKGTIPKAAVARTYPIAERHNLLWFWPGDPALADESKIPDYGFMTDRANWSTIHGYMHLKVSHDLVVDNLTDLSHAPFVHEGLLEGRDVCKGEFKVIRKGEVVETINWCPGIEPPPFFKMLKGTAELVDAQGLVDHWQDMRFEPPACMITYYGIAPRGGTREQGMDTYNPNFVTPETPTTSHYFWAGSRNFDINDSVVNELFRRGYDYAFEHQDRPILEAQQKMLGGADLMGMHPVMLVNDAGSIQVRRVLQERREAEQAQGRSLTPGDK